MLLAHALGSKSCAVTFTGPGSRSGPFALLTQGRAYVSFRWTVPSNAAPGVWTARLACAMSATRYVSSQQLVLQGARAHGPLAGSVSAVARSAPPARAARGADAGYVRSVRPETASWGNPAGWWKRTPDAKGAAPQPGAIAWWSASQVPPIGYAAIVDRVAPGGVWVSEAGAYTPGVVDHALVPRAGHGAPAGYIYETATTITIPPTSTTTTTTSSTTTTTIPPTGTPTTSSTTTTTTTTVSAASASLYVWPAADSARVGGTFSVDVRLTPSADGVSAASAQLSYPAGMLSVLSAGLPDEDGTGDVTWGTPTLQSAPGNLTITVSSPTAVSDDHPIVLVTFQALAVGTATITPTAGSVVSAVPGQSVAVTDTGASATIDAALAPPATSQLSLAPPAGPSDLARTATASSPVGSQITVPVYADVTSGEVNAVGATVDYPSSLLQYDERAGQHRCVGGDDTEHRRGGGRADRHVEHRAPACRECPGGDDHVHGTRAWDGDRDVRRVLVGGR